MRIMKRVGNMNLTLAKVFGILFGILTLFYVGYTIWTIFYDPLYNRLINRTTNLLLSAYITYAIHSDIRARVRYVKDLPLYQKVEEAMKKDHIYQAIEKELARDKGDGNTL